MASPRKPNRYRTGDDALDEQLQEILEHVGAARDRDVLFEILVTAALLAGDGADRLDLKLTSAALKEMRAAFRAFAPYSDIAKVTIFGSARTGSGDPSYDQAKELARLMAAADWMVVTGAGPGIMAAGMEGAGREHSFGVNIRLPHEQGANEFIAGDTKLVSMKYFFTRKLMLMKESTGFVSLPGGFGTLDETLELLTLLQTGKADPAPVVLLDRPDGGFWAAFVRFVRQDVLPRGLVDDNDLDLVLVTDDVKVACDELQTFVRNYRSIRWVGKDLVVRMAHAPTDDELAELDAEFGTLSLDGHLRRSEPLAAEVTDGDGVDLARIVLRYGGFEAGRLRRLINALNRLPSLD